MKYDSNELNLMFGDDEEIFHEIFHDFVETKPKMLGDIKSAIESNNSSDLEISAHTLKGVVATFCSTEAKKIAFELEQKGRKGDLSDVNDLYDKLSEEIESLIKALKSHDFGKAA